MMYYAVIDTNVIVSSMLKGTSIPGIIVSKALDGQIIPYPFGWYVYHNV